MSERDLPGPAHLPPHPRINRGAPDDCVRRAGRQPLHRAPNRLEHQEKSVRTARHYRTVIIQPGRQTLTAADPLPDDLRDALATIGSTGAH